MSELRFDGRVAVITGAGAGLGRAYAIFLAARGAKVVLNDLVPSIADTTAQTVAAEITDAGGAAVANDSNVSTPEGAQQLIQAALDAYGQVDILINNAGMPGDLGIHKVAPGNFGLLVTVHLMSAQHLTKQVFAHMSDRGYGRIVYTAPIAGLYGDFARNSSLAANAGLTEMSKAIADEGAEYGIKVNVLAPLAVSSVVQHLVSDEVKGFTPEHVAPVVGYLCHDTCAISGKILSAYGGHVSAIFVTETRGVTSPSLTMEYIAANLNQIFDPAGHVEPESTNVSFQF
jgi:NAD(P)-dependent dehydrogenase (short-subunit alcohol dehydrogenase family)